MLRPGNNGYQAATLKNDPFWPALELEDFQRQRSIPPDISHETVAGALLTAVSEINATLQSVVSRHQRSGHATAADVPGPEIDGINALTALYIRAIHARAKADLMGEFASVARQVENTGQDAPQTRASLLAESAVALRHIKGLKRVGVHLI